MSSDSNDRPNGEISVLLAASEADTRSAIADVLERCGCKVQAMSDGQSTVDALCKGRPRLLLVDLLLPELDGFEVCQSLRGHLGDADVAVICMSDVPWGAVNLRDVLARRFKASLLQKPFTSQELLQQIRTALGSDAVADPQTEEQSIGAQDVENVSGLIDEYEREVARIVPDSSNSAARLRHEYQADVGSHNEGFTALTQDLSPGGFFVRTYTPPQPDDLVEVSLLLAEPDVTVRAQARVVHQVSPEKAKRYGATPGFGVEFIDLCTEDAALIDDVLRTSGQGSEGPEPDAPDGEDRPKEERRARTWIALLGISAKALRACPSFLQRSAIGLVAFPDVESAEDFLRANPIAACIVSDAALAEDADEVFVRVARLAGGDAQRMVLSRRPEVDELLKSGRCDAAFDPDADLSTVIEELQTRLGIPHRSNDRFSHQATVHIRARRREVEGRPVQINCATASVRISEPLSVGTRVHFELSLAADIPPIAGSGLVLRCTRPRDAEFHLTGVAFSSFADGDESRLQAYVRSRVSFRDLFTWLKQAHFGSATDE